jgi:hypothetical protein
MTKLVMGEQQAADYARHRRRQYLKNELAEEADQERRIARHDRCLWHNSALQHDPNPPETIFQTTD